MEIFAIVMFCAIVVWMMTEMHSLAKSLGGGWLPLVLIVTWLAVIGAMSASGFFADFSSIPPRFVVVLAVPLATIIVLATNKSIGNRLQQVDPQKLVRFQSMRIGVEICLFLLALEHIAPKLVTPEGRNFDVIIGLSALFAVRWVTKKSTKTLAIVWNIAGIILVSNVVVHGILAAPTPFQMFFTDPPNTFISTLPWIWLPGFIVPVAILGHVLSLRQLLKK